MPLRALLNRFNSIELLYKYQFGKYLITTSKQYSDHVQKVLSQPTVDENAEKKKKKTVPIPKITLVSPGDVMSVTTLEEAQKLSKRRDLKLVKIIDVDTKTQRPVYRLMTGAEYFVADKEQRQKKKDQRNSGGIKGEKMLTLSYRISEHDLNSKIKNISKWLAKSFEVRTIIAAESQQNLENAEKIYSSLEDALKSEGKFVQKRSKFNDIRFQIVPIKREYSTNAHGPDND